MDLVAHRGGGSAPLDGYVLWPVQPVVGECESRRGPGVPRAKGGFVHCVPMSNLGKEIKELVAAIEATPGWRVEESRHYKAYAPDGVTMVTISKTPGSQARIAAYKAQFTKLGVDFRKGRKKP